MITEEKMLTFDIKHFIQIEKYDDSLLYFLM